MPRRPLPAGLMRRGWTASNGGDLRHRPNPMNPTRCTEVLTPAVNEGTRRPAKKPKGIHLECVPPRIAKKGHFMATFNRRTFLIRGSGVIAAAGAATALPAFLPILAGADAAEPKAATSPKLAGSATDSDSGPMTEPLVAHIRDLSTGEIGLFSGDREIVIHNRQLARTLHSASR
jgi:hypothetical protein